MQVALRQLAEDFLSSFVFLGVYLATGNLPLAVGTGMAVGAAQLAFAKWRGRRLEAMQWLSFGLVIVLGAISLIIPLLYRSRESRNRGFRKAREESRARRETGDERERQA